jgi:EmrB/QacA subfamily drug resistance transporter
MSIDNRIKILITVSCAAFASTLMSSSINIALPNISEDFNISASTLPWINTALFLASAVFLLPAGRLADILGPRRIFTAGLIILVIASVACALSLSELMLILFRAFQGIGNALIVTASAVIVVSIFPLKETGKALGYFLVSVYVGLTLGPLIGGLMTEYLGWRSLFLLCLPLGMISFFFLWQVRTVPDKVAGGRFDLVGSLILAGVICLTIYGLTQIPDLAGISFIIGGLACLGVFIWWEKRLKSPLVNLDLFNHNRTFIFSNIAALIIYSATVSLSLILSLYIQYIKGFSPQNAGLILGVLSLVDSIFTPIAGRLSDRINPRNLATSGIALSTVGLGLLYFINQNTSIFYIVIALIIIGFGLALFVSPNTNAIMRSVSPSVYGIASGISSMARQFGVMLSLAIITIIFSVFIGDVEITPEYYPAFLKGIKFALGIFVVLCFAGIFASFARGTRDNN